jgi:hypothetical protein
MHKALEVIFTKISRKDLRLDARDQSRIAGLPRGAAVSAFTAIAAELVVKRNARYL